MNRLRARQRLSLILDVLEDRRLPSQFGPTTSWSPAPDNRDSQAEFGSPTRAGGSWGVQGWGYPSQGHGPGTGGGRDGWSQQSFANQNGSIGGNNPDRAAGGTNSAPSPAPQPPPGPPQGSRGDQNGQGGGPVNLAPPLTGRGGPSVPSQVVWISVVPGNASSTGSGAAVVARAGGDSIQAPSAEAAAVVTADSGVQSLAQESAVAALVTMAIAPQTASILPVPIAAGSEAQVPRAHYVGSVHGSNVRGDLPLPTGETPSPTVAIASGATPAESDVPRTPLEAIQNLLENGLDLTDPQAADLITGFLPFSAESLHHAIDQFLDPMEGVGGGLPELAEPSNLGPASWAVAATVVALEVAIRIKRSRRRDGAKQLSDEPTPRFPGLPDHWRLSRS